jgi:hypothetical protein
MAKGGDVTGVRLVERFELPDPGGWLRLLPVGTFARFGRELTVTPEMVREMQENFGHVPETGVPVTRAHDDAAGKVGDLVEVHARPDGLWGRIRWSATGLRLLAEGAFRYLSPEILWGPVDYDGRTVRNVLAGLSLVNRPFFGQQVSLFRLQAGAPPEEDQQYQQKEGDCMDDTVEVPCSFFERLMARLWPQGEEARARLRELEARRALVERFGALETAGLGQGWADRLVRVAEFDEELADEIAARFRALLAQNAQGALFAEIGATGGQAAGPVERFNAAIKAAMHTYGLDYVAAGQKIAAEQPELYGEYQAAVTNKL